MYQLDPSNSVVSQSVRVQCVSSTHLALSAITQLCVCWHHRYGYQKLKKYLPEDLAMLVRYHSFKSLLHREKKVCMHMGASTAHKFNEFMIAAAVAE